MDSDQPRNSADYAKDMEIFRSSIAFGQSRKRLVRRTQTYFEAGSSSIVGASLLANFDDVASKLVPRSDASQSRLLATFVSQLKMSSY